MNGAAWTAAGVGIAALCGLLGVWLTNRREGRKNNVDVATQLIEQFQEERRDLVERLNNADRRIGRLEDRERVLLDYVSRLRWHIEQNTGPPPPEFPSSLLPK